MTTPGAPASFNAALNADPSILRMQVTPENVMQLHRALAAEAQLVKLHTNQAIMAKVSKAAKDPVSRTAAGGFNNKRKALSDQCEAYMAGLESTADELAKTAQIYGNRALHEALPAFCGCSAWTGVESPVHKSARRPPPG